MQSTLHYNFPLYEGEDTPNLLVEWNSTMQALDTKLYALSIGNSGPEIIREIEQLITAVNGLIDEVTQAISDIDELQQTVNGVQSTVTSLFNNIDEIQDSVVALQGVITTVQQLVASLQEDVTGNTDDISSLQSSVNTLTSSVSTLNGALENMQGSISSLNTRVSQTESAMNTKLSTCNMYSFPSQPVQSGMGAKIYIPYYEFDGQEPPEALNEWLKGTFFYNGYIVDLCVKLPDDSEVVIMQLIAGYMYDSSNIRPYYQNNYRFYVPQYNRLNIGITPADRYNIGGIKVGEGFNITQDGTLTPRIASRYNLGAVKIGNGLSISQDGTISTSSGGATLSHNDFTIIEVDNTHVATISYEKAQPIIQNNEGRFYYSDQVYPFLLLGYYQSGTFQESTLLMSGCEYRLNYYSPDSIGCSLVQQNSMSIKSYGGDSPLLGVKEVVSSPLSSLDITATLDESSLGTNIELFSASEKTVNSLYNSIKGVNLADGELCFVTLSCAYRQTENTAPIAYTRDVYAGLLDYTSVYETQLYSDLLVPFKNLTSGIMYIGSRNTGGHTAIAIFDMDLDVIPNTYHIQYVKKSDTIAFNYVTGVCFVPKISSPGASYSNVNLTDYVTLSIYVLDQPPLSV